MPHVVQVDLRQTRCGGQLLEPSRDRVRVRRPPVLPLAIAAIWFMAERLENVIIADEKNAYAA